jgi:hypothetical protein
MAELEQSLRVALTDCERDRVAADIALVFRLVCLVLDLAGTK